MTDPQKLSRDLIKLFRDPDEFIGICSGTVESDGTVNVVRPDGTSVSARLANAGRGSKTLCQRINGIWYAWREGESSIESERVISERRSRPDDQQTSGLVKILFYLQEEGGYNYYIGGDRKKPKKIHSSPNYYTEAYLSNLGRGIDNYAVAIKENSANSSSLIIKNIIKNKTFACQDNFATTYLKWQGGGLWAGSVLNDSRAVNSVTTSNPPTYSGGWIIYESTTTYDFISAIEGLNGSGSGTHHNIAPALLDGNNDNPGPYPGNSYEDRQQFTVENKTFSFLRTLKAYSTQTNYLSEAGSSTAAGNTSSSSYLNQVSSSTLKAPLFDTGLTITEESQNTRNYTESGTSASASGNGTQQDIQITALISGVDSWIYKKQTTTQNLSNSSSPTPINEYLLKIEKRGKDGKVQIASYTYNANFPTLLNSINPKLGATLKNNKFYFLPPSKVTNDTSALYGKDLWAGKTKTAYPQNVYDNPTLNNNQPTKMPVWVTEFQENAIAVLPDIETLVYPLPANAIVVAASYCP